MSGTYTQITEIVAPSSAAAGETVSVEVRVKNLHTAGIYIIVTARVVDGDIVLLFGNVYHAVDAGVIQSFYDSFIMPNNSVRLWAWSWYWTGTEWYQDDEASKDISLGVVPGFTEFAIASFNKV